MFSDEKYRRQMIDTTITLFPLLAMAFCYYGFRVLILAAISIVTAAAADYICLLFQGRKWWKKYDFSPIIIGLIYVLMLPASAPYWLAVFGSAFAIVVVRHPFGGCYHTMFHPALTAFAFVLLCWNPLVTKYPQIFTQLPLDPVINVPLYDSSAYRLMLGGGTSLSLLDALLGNFHGPMGTTCITVLICCGIYLMVRRTIHWQIPAASLSIIAICAYLFPRINGNPLFSVITELTSGVLLFAIIFIASMDNGEIETTAGKWICGGILGGTMVLFSHLSYIELVSPFAIIILNAIDARCDAYAANLSRWIKAAASGTAQGVLFTVKKTGSLLQKGIRSLNNWMIGSGKEGK